MSDQFRVSVSKDDLVFSAAHFITFNGDQCERLHGHNYRVRAEVVGALDENHYVVDFIFLRNALREIVGALDHRVLLPTKHAQISVTRENDEVVARFENRRWVFPTNDCILLPLENTTAELLGQHILDRLVERFTEVGIALPRSMFVAVEENFGQWGTCERHFERAE